VKQRWNGKAASVLGLVAMFSIDAIFTGASTHADTSMGLASSSKSTNGEQLAQASPSSSTIEELRQEIQAEHQRTLMLEERLDKLQQNQTGEAQKQDSLQGVISNLQAGRGNERTAQGTSQADVYDRGFFLRSKNGRFSLNINGLAQIRYSFFKPNAVGRYGVHDNSQSDFQIYLGRLAFSGNVFDPSLKYFFQIQGFTTANSNNMTLLDWFTSKTFSPYLTLQVGRSWTAYTWEFYANPAWLTFPDLSTAEYAFVLPRATGLALYGQAGKLSYEAELTNGVPALDSGGNENIGSKMAYIGHLQYDILAPAFFGYSETHPEDSFASEPGLSVWGSGMYNPVNSSSTFENELPGDTTYGANGSAGFRWGYLTLQGTGYYRHTNPGTAAHLQGTKKSYDSWGYAEQVGYYIIPGQWEIAQRISGVAWGAPEIPTAPPGGHETYWFSGPDLFSYHKITEFSGGLNYYIFNHNAKIELEYSYLAGKDFRDRGFGANRIWLQSQLQF
jgi:hypothetical protein